MDIQKPKNSYKKEIILFTITLLVIFIFWELFFRGYYWHYDRHIARDENELCLKEMKLDNLPSTKKKGQKINFIDFQRLGYWDDDPVLGITVKKGYTEDEYRPIKVDGILKKFVMYDEHHYSNQGLQGLKEFSLEKPNKGSIRIALFGDSFTCGGEMPLRFGMASILETIIPGSDVLNFCVGGRGIETMYARYVYEGKKFHPDVVVFNVFVDDLRRPFGCPILTPNITVNNGTVMLGQRQWKTLKDFYQKYQLPRFESYFVKHVQWIYNQQTKYKTDMKKGLELFEHMLDGIRNENTTFIIGVIQQAYPSDISVNYYDQLIALLKRNNLSFLDSQEYFRTKRTAYKNQSFYFIDEEKPLGHFSVIGNALYAQALKNMLEKKGNIPKTKDYFFANFGRTRPLYLIEHDATVEKEATINKIVPYEIKDLEYTNHKYDEENRRTEAYAAKMNLSSAR